MSWEAWGDDDADRYDHLLEGGWWASEQVAEVVAAIKALTAERIYEGGKKENGIAVEFIARLFELQVAAGLLSADDVAQMQKTAAAFYASGIDSPPKAERDAASRLDPEGKSPAPQSGETP